MVSSSFTNLSIRKFREHIQSNTEETDDEMAWHSRTADPVRTSRCGDGHVQERQGMKKELRGILAAALTAMPVILCMVVLGAGSTVHAQDEEKKLNREWESDSSGIISYEKSLLNREKDGNGFELLVRTDETVTAVKAAVWTKENGQDDLIWYELEEGSWEKNGQTYNQRAEILIAEHGNEAGYYETDLYAYSKKRQADVLRTEAFMAGYLRVGDAYFLNFSDAFERADSGEVIYVFDDFAERGDAVVPAGKSLTVKPEADVEITAVPGSTSERILGAEENASLTISGDGKHTLTFRTQAGVEEDSGILQCMGRNSKITVLSGVNLTASKGFAVHGVYADSQIIVDGAKIFENHAGIGSFGKVYVKSGSIYNNASDGIQLNGNDNLSGLYITGGTIYGNGSAGVNCGGNTPLKENQIITGWIENAQIYGNQTGITLGTAHISGTNRWKLVIEDSEIYENKRGIQVGNAGSNEHAQLDFQSGNVRNNAGTGIYVWSGTLNLRGGAVTHNLTEEHGGGIFNRGTCNLTGGIISENQAALGSGIYQNGILNMSREAAVNENNDVYLTESHYVTVPEKLILTGNAVLTPDTYRNGRTMVKVEYGEKQGSAEYLSEDQTEKFRLTPKGGSCLRPADFQSKEAKTDTSALVISTVYDVKYDADTQTGDSVENLPETGRKYWYEDFTISEKIPVWGIIRFLGWGMEADSPKAEYQPEGVLSAELNRDLTLYAVWEDEILIRYAGNGADSGAEKSEVTNPGLCAGSGGYLIRKNKGYTEYQREDGKFLGWNPEMNVGPGEVKYSESEECRLTYQELMALAAQQQNSMTEGMQTVILYAAWDTAPVIEVKGVKEFYEGTDVTKPMLLENVSVSDAEDGDLTEQVRITRLVYDEGKLVNQEKQKGWEQVWNPDMPDEEKLDTWFLQLDEQDSLAVHEITYEVTDSAGNTSVLEWTVKVKYNEFPKLYAQDRYFTLEEAQGGEITEEALLKQALESGKIKAEDAEDDRLYPGTLEKKIRLADFVPEEFTRFTDSGYVVMTLAVKDSMGPGGEGKETLCQFTVFIVNDGQIPVYHGEQYVRFINETYYFQEEEEGGMLSDSKWYQDPQYRNVIESAWDEEKSPQQIWRFTKGDTELVKTYVELYGIGNSQDEQALERFLQEFGELRQK